MFFSHQLLARKAPLGQIWMAATMHAKMNRRKLNRLNIIKICEEILNPQVPMALRLSGILMGGVVIVYERKVKLLYDDVNRLLVEINEAWKVKAAPDPTVLPKGKSQARKEAVTLPQLEESDLEDVEQLLNCSNKINMEFQQPDYFHMRLDNVDDTYVQNNPGEVEPPQNFHQADVDNITLFERFDLYQTNTEMQDRFERFDIDEDVETQLNFTSGEQTQMPTTHVPSSPPQDEPQRADEVHDHYPENQVNQQSDESKKARQGRQKQGQLKRKTRRPATPVLDFEQTMIPGHTYQSWLQDSSDICSRRGKKKKATTNILFATKIAKLMELPPLVYEDVLTTRTGEIHYPAPLLELWIKKPLPPHNSSSARTSPPQPPEPSMSSPPVEGLYQDPDRSPFEDIHSGVGSQPLSIENRRTNLVDNNNLAEEIRANFMNINAFRANEVNPMVTPGKSDDVRSIPSSASGHGNSEINSGRSNPKRPYSSSRISSNGLEPVAEETDPNFNLSMPSENGLTSYPETLVETGPTQTQPPITNPPADKITDSIRMQMKSHFDTPGAPKVESLNSLAAGLTRKAAAMLFYQTCVLATDGSLRVEQKVPYGDIFISKGAKM